MKLIRIIFLIPSAFSLISTLVLPLSAEEPQAGAAYTGKPYGGKPQIIPGNVMAGLYDVAPDNMNGIAYNRKGVARPGLARSTGDCIGLGVVGDDHVGTDGKKQKNGDVYVGWTEIGDWWKYTVQVKEAGTYYFGGKFAAGNKGAKITAEFMPIGKPAASAVTTGPVEVPTTAGFQPAVEVYHVWETLDKMAEIKLEPGLYVLTIKLDGRAGVNIQYYSFLKK